MDEKVISEKVCRLEEGHKELSGRVMEVERVQSGLVEAVKGVKRSVDRVHDNLSSLSETARSFGKALVLSVWVAMVLGAIKMFM